jgi:alpha-beta hydrolase superfamily lysophospholipase
MQSKSRLRGGLWYRLALTLLALALAATVVFLAGPRNTLGPNAPTQRPLPPPTSAALEGWLQKSEAAFADIKPGNAKGIIWNAADRQRTPWSVVYLHGFSASRLETAPLAEFVGKALGANVFYTRLSGHGRAGNAMGEATVQDWMADALEAVLIGQTLGERVLVISCSTGSTLAAWLATSPEAHRVAAHAFVSPNFGPKDKKAELINGPWGKNIALALEGETRGWTPEDAREANAWTSRYPTRALFPMMAMVKTVRESDLSTFQTPVLILHSEQDQTVDPLETQSAFSRVGAPLKSIEVVNYSKSKGQHVLAGDIKGPEATLPMAQSITKWVQALPKQGI